MTGASERRHPALFHFVMFLTILTELVGSLTLSQHFQVYRAQAARWPDQLIEDRESVYLGRSRFSLIQDGTLVVGILLLCETIVY